MIRIFKPFIILLLCGCSTPDLRDEDVFSKAQKEAIEISKLNKEFMHGMMWLYTDDRNETFSGWVKESYPNQNLKFLGYLKNGQKQGAWMSWHENGQKESDLEWNKDMLHGVFKKWHANGELSVLGQTVEGEMNGEWKEYYTTGKPESHSDNHMGKLIWKKIWCPNGKLCTHSRVENGNGIYFEYNEDNNNSIRRVFKDGVEIEASSSKPI